MSVKYIRNSFRNEYVAGNFTIDRNGGKTIELLGASFIADEYAIFGKPSKNYIDAELEWYKSQSTNINDIYADERHPPLAWQMAADPHGNINSNYGYLIYSPKYFGQFKQVLDELMNNTDTRRASMIYTRPSVWVEYDEGGKSDFICTNTVTYYIRDKKLHAVVQMRSNDCWAGYRNDFAWQKFVLNELVLCYNCNLKMNPIEIGTIFWQVQNLHMYERNFYLLEHYIKTGETHIIKKDFDILYK